MGAVLSKRNKELVNKNWGKLKCSPAGPNVAPINDNQSTSIKFNQNHTKWSATCNPDVAPIKEKHRTLLQIDEI